MFLNRNQIAYCLIAIGLVTGCTSPPESHDAKVGDARQAPDAITTAVQRKANIEDSKITWIGTKPTGRHHGSIKLAEAFLSIKEENITGGTVIIDMHTIDVSDLSPSTEDYSRLLDHLKSKEFFDVEHYQTAKFEITSVTKLDNKTNYITNDREDHYNVHHPNYSITGNLTIKATTLSISFPCEISVLNDQLLAKAKFNIDRTKWGVSYNEESKFVDKAKDGLIHNIVNVGFELFIPKQRNI